MSDAPSGGWTVSYAKQAEKDIARLDAKLRRRILLAIGRLAADPDTATGVRKLTGRLEWRLRIGDWRVRFVRDSSAQVIYIMRVLPRGGAYDR
jgi:mRNA interferase RelE/StbE